MIRREPSIIQQEHLLRGPQRKSPAERSIADNDWLQVINECFHRLGDSILVLTRRIIDDPEAVISLESSQIEVLAELYVKFVPLYGSHFSIQDVALSELRHLEQFERMADALADVVEIDRNESIPLQREYAIRQLITGIYDRILCRAMRNSESPLKPERRVELLCILLGQYSDMMILSKKMGNEHAFLDHYGAVTMIQEELAKESLSDENEIRNYAVAADSTFIEKYSEDVLEDHMILPEGNHGMIHLLRSRPMWQ